MMIISAARAAPQRAAWSAVASSVRVLASASAPSNAASRAGPLSAQAAALPAAQLRFAHAQAQAHSRTPAIHFRYGRRQQIDEQLGRSSSTTSSAAAPHGSASSPASPGLSFAAFDSMFPSKASKTYLDVPPMFGRPKLSADEGFWISSGGAFGDVPPPPPKGAKGAKPAKK
jgi:hypothetical protein